METAIWKVREVELGRWVVDYVTDAGSTSGYTTFPTKDAALLAVKDRDPDATIEVVALQ